LRENLNKCVKDSDANKTKYQSERMELNAQIQVLTTNFNNCR